MTELGPIDLKLTSSGIQEVLNAFKDVQAAADRLDKLSRSARTVAVAEAKARLELAKAATAEARAKEKGARQAADVEKAQAMATLKATTEAQKEQTRVAKSEQSARLALVKSGADQEIREATRSANARAAVSRQLAGRIVSDFRSTLGTATRLFGGIMALGGGLSLQSAFSSELKLSKSATALEIASDVPGRPEQKVSAAEATRNARQLGLEYATPAADVLEAQHAIVAKTGMGRRSQELVGDVMKIATAEGADPKELATALASAMAQNPKLTNEEAKNLLKMMVDQGKVGAIEIKDMAKILPILTKTATLYTGKQSDNQARLVTMVQSAITTTGGPEQAAVAVSRFGDWMSSKKGSKALQQRGFNVFDQNGQLKPIDELMAGVLTHGGNTAQGLGQMGMEGKAKSLVEAFQGVYNSAIKAGKTHEQAANEALKAYHEELAMRITDEKVKEHLTAVQGTMAFKVEQNMEKLNQAIGKDLAPVLTRLITQIGAHADDIAAVMQKIGEFISWAAEHPWKAIAIAGAAAFAKAVAVEVAASGLKTLLAKLIPGGGGGGGVPGGAGAGVVGPAIGTGIATAAVIANAAIKTEKGKEEAMDLAAKVRAWDRDPTNPNAMSPQEAQKRVQAAKDRLKKTNPLEQAANLALSPILDVADRDYGQYKADQGLTGEGLWLGEEKPAEDLQKAIDDANKHHEDNTKATQENTTAMNNLSNQLATATPGIVNIARDAKGNVIIKTGGASSDW